METLGFDLTTSGDPRDYTRFPTYEIDIHWLIKMREWVKIYQKSGVWPDVRLVEQKVPKI